MPSPFPGMDPYLEGYLWQDVHHQLASEIRRMLVPRIRPRYIARIETRVIQEDAFSGEISIMYPDIEVLLARSASRLREAQVALLENQATDTKIPQDNIPPAPLVVPLLDVLEFRQATIEVRDRLENKLITTIELVSPANKREPDLTRYRQKRRRLIDAGVHLLEIDLIRRGTRPIVHPDLPDTAYLVALTRSYARKMELWPLRLQDPLPVLPVPLREPDPDVPLELGAALSTVYDEAAYDLSIDYSEDPPPPPLSDENAAWLAQKASGVQ